MIHNYTSNISREQFELIREDLENARKKTRPRTIDLYEVFCGVLYLLTTGCQWRNLPRGFPNWKTVYSYYQIWRKIDENGISLLEKVHKKMGRKVPQARWADEADKFLHRRCTKCEKYMDS